MDTLSSAEFRKVYAKLTEATIVMNGHAIGVWNPSGAKGIAAVRDWEGPAFTMTNAHDSDDTIRKAWSTSKPVPKRGR